MSDPIIKLAPPATETPFQRAEREQREGAVQDAANKLTHFEHLQRTNPIAAANFRVRHAREISAARADREAMHPAAPPPPPTAERLEYQRLKSKNPIAAANYLLANRARVFPDDTNNNNPPPKSAA